MGSHFSCFSNFTNKVSQAKDKKCRPRWPCISVGTAQAFYKARNSYYDMDQTTVREFSDDSSAENPCTSPGSGEDKTHLLFALRMHPGWIFVGISHILLSFLNDTD